MNATTVKIMRKTKTALDELKSGRDSYDDVIAKLIENNRKKELRKELVRGYKSIGKEELEMLNDWDSASADVE